MRWALVSIVAAIAGLAGGWLAQYILRLAGVVRSKAFGGLKNAGRLPSAGVAAAWRRLKEDPSSKSAVKLRVLAGTAAALAALIFAPFILAGLLGAGTYFGIGRYFERARQREREKFDDQLAAALNAVAAGVRAGRSLTQALEGAAAQGGAPLSTALDAMLGRVRLGVPLARSLSEMADTAGSRELHMAVTSINLAAETGGPLGEILLQLSDTLRERKKLHGKVLSLTAQARASGTIMSLVPLFLLTVLYFMEPGIFGLLFTTVPGNLMLSVVFAMVGCGAWFINRIVSIEL